MSSVQTKVGFTVAVFVSMFQAVLAQSAGSAPNVHFVWMGSSDCPPCVVWRREELPKLKNSQEFARVTYSYVQKQIRSPVPSAFFLPDEVKPVKGQLDLASSGRRGSPQAAILVNGEVYDYFLGPRSAEDIERMLLAIRTGGEYPFKRCVRMAKQGAKCEVAG